MVLVGYSMGGLLARLLTLSSGDSVAQLFSRVPIDQLRTTTANREMYRSFFVFEPAPMVHRTIFIATPHNGSNLAGRSLGRVTRNFVRPPEESTQAYCQIRRDNPGALTELASKPLTSIDLLLEGGPFLETMARLPRNPAVTTHTILGTAHRGLLGPKGDFIVPIESASIPDSRSELHVQATHLNIVPNPQTIAETSRILQENLLETPLAPPPPR